MVAALVKRQDEPVASRNYRDLRVWSASMDLVVLVYGLTSRFPHSEQFGLSSQLRRTAVSVPSNMAEGQARSSVRDFLRFLAIAMGSLAELDTQLVLATRLGYIPAASFLDALEQVDCVARMLKRLQQILNRRIATPPT